MTVPSQTPSTRAHRAAALAGWLTKAGTGDRQAFADFYDGTSAQVHGLVLRVLRNQAQSEEVTQEVYLQVWRIASQYDPAKGTANAWLMTLTHRRSVERVRSSEAARRNETSYHHASFQPDHDSTALAAERASEATRVTRALGELSPVQREAIELAYFGGWTHTEIAEMTGSPIGTAKTRIRDGLIRLREILDDAA